MNQHYAVDFSEYTTIPESYSAIAIYRRTLPQITTLCDTLIDGYIVSLFLLKHVPTIVIRATTAIDITVQGLQLESTVSVVGVLLLRRG